MKPTYIIALLIIFLSFLISIILYPSMPDSMASHWNAQGEVNGYLPKFWGVFLMPIIAVAMFLLLICIPYFDPLKKNIEKFRKHYEIFILMLLLFLLYIHLISLAWNKGFRFPFTALMIPAFSILLYYCGILMENAKRNWFIGIRTPWTLSSDKVWNKTHKWGARLFKLSALISLIGLLFLKFSIFFILVPMITSTLFLVIYSYLEYRKL